MADLLAGIRKVLDANVQSKFAETGKQFFDYLAPDYKHQLSGKFALIDGNKIEESVTGQDIIVTKKLDGEMRTVFFDGEKAVMYTTGGKEQIQDDFPCLKEFAEKLKSSGVRTGGFAAELNIISADGKRTRVTDVIHAVADKTLHSSLSLSPFDILFIDNKEWKVEHYRETYEKLEKLFGSEGGKSNSLVLPVPMKKASSSKEVQEIYNQWVIKEKAEGLVVHNELPIILKIKPQHTIDAAVIGYTTNEEGVRDLLFATIDENKLFRVFASGGNGLTDNQRKCLLVILEEKNVSSSFIYTDSRGVAFQMIKPEMVFEVTAIDFSAENCMHQANKNKLISFDEEKGWTLEKISAGVSTYSLKIIRHRDDKEAVYEDIRTEQITNICPFSKDEKDSVCKENLPLSTILERSVYKKRIGKSVYVKKFVILKTNKEDTGKFAPYVLHYSDFSPRREENLKKKIIVSKDYEQLHQIMIDLIYREVDGNWVYV